MEGLLYVGRVTHSFNFGGHRITIATPEANDSLKAALLIKQYQETAGALRALTIAAIATCLVKVDGHVLPRGIMADGSDDLEARYNWVSRLHTTVIDGIYREYENPGGEGGRGHRVPGKRGRTRKGAIRPWLAHLLRRAYKQGVFASRHLTWFQVSALDMYLQVEHTEKAEDKEWQVKMALLSADPVRFGPIIFPASKEEPDEKAIEELQPGDLTVGGFNSDITVKYKRIPTPEEVEEILAGFPQEMTLGVDDFQFARDERLTNGHRKR